MTKIILALMILLSALTTRAFSQTATAEEETAALMLQADQAVNTGDYSTARLNFQKALDLYEHQKNPKAVADASYNLGVVCIALSNYAEARKALRQALALHEKLKDDQAAASDMTEIANIEFFQTNYEESLKIGQKALAIHEKEQNQKGIADTLRVIGMTYQFQGDYEKALDYLERSLTAATEIGDKRGIAKSLRGIGGVHWRKSNLTLALQLYEKALPMAEETQDRETQSRLLGNIGLVVWNQGDFGSALDYYQRSLKIAEETGIQQIAALNLYNMGLLYMNQGELTKALDSLQRSLELSRQLGDKGLESVCIHGLGEVNRYLGNLNLAKEYFEKSLRLSQETGEKRTQAYALKDIGMMDMELHNYAAALRYFQKSMHLYEELQEQRAIADSLVNIGEIHSIRGDQDRALEYYTKALSIHNSLGHKPGMANTYQMMGEAYYKKGDMLEAESDLQKAINIAEDMGHSHMQWQSLYAMGQVLRDTGRTGEGLQSLKEAINTVEKMRSELQSGEEKTAFLQEKLNLYQDTVKLLLADGNIPDAFEYVQKSKARAFLDMLAEARIDPDINLESEYREKKRNLVKELVDAEKNIQDERDQDSVDQAKLQHLQRNMDQLEVDYSNLILEIRKVNPRYADVQYPEPLKLAEAQALLDDNSVLLEYLVGNRGSFLFAITTDGVRTFDLPNEQTLTQHITQIREALLKPDAAYQITEQSHTKYVKLARTLYSNLIEPAASVLDGKKRIVIAADGALNYLPFEVLLTHRIKTEGIDFSKLPYLAKDFEVQYVPSASVLASIMKSDRPIPEEGQKALVAFADPVLRNLPATKGKTGESISGVRGWVGTLSPLPNARTEVERIARLFPKDDVTVLIGSEASERNLKRMDLQKFRKLHFASHGLIDEEKPEYSALLLSGESHGEEDGYLTMREVFDLKLNADLVVLSACKTGLGKEIRGEGVTGISRAFLCAGTPSVLVTLWDVYDRSTADLMTSFYRAHETRGMNKAAALKEAQVEMIRSKKYSHPYYWAPFVLIGSR
jgi:CHAT domain-containing protein/tetratricopeptide (TPR) repeat protein